jgi:hypothetical protein
MIMHMHISAYDACPATRLSPFQIIDPGSVKAGEASEPRRQVGFDLAPEPGEIEG